MIYYPITIPTLCRYEHFKRCIESLAKNTHADKTELIIGLDYPSKEEHVKGYQQICDYIPQIVGFKKVKVFKHKKNLGPSVNNKIIRKYAFSLYDACIFTEDDNEFSPCFLDFMNKALITYKEEEKISSISGYTSRDYEKIGIDDILFTHDNCAWGLGIWKVKEEIIKDNLFYKSIWKSSASFWTLFLKTPAVAHLFAVIMFKNEKLGDVMRSVRNIKKNTFQVKPSTSLVRNWGYDGSGLHCPNIDETMCKQKISANLIFENDFKKQIKNSLPFSVEFFYLLPKNRLKAILKIIKIGLSCLKMRFICNFYN